LSEAGHIITSIAEISLVEVLSVLRGYRVRVLQRRVGLLAVLWS
jgi:hypothetical protein